MVGQTEFKGWLTKSNMMENIIIGYLVAQAIIEFYDALFVDVVKPIISYYIPGNLETKANIFNGPNIRLNNFGSELIKFILSILFAFYLHKYLKKYKNGKL